MYVCISEALLRYFLTTHVTSLNPSVMLVALKARRNPPEANGDSATKNSASIGTLDHCMCSKSNL